MVTDAEKRKQLVRLLNGAIANRESAERRLAAAEKRLNEVYAASVDVRTIKEGALSELKRAYHLAADAVLSDEASVDDRLAAIDRVNSTMDLMEGLILQARTDIAAAEKAYNSANAELGTARQQLGLREDEVRSLKERISKELVLAECPPF